MERPRSQITNAAGQRQMRAIFEPLGWAVREVPQDTDVGIDFEVEIFENYLSTGDLFKIQLRSSTRSEYSTKRNAVRQGVKRKHLTYYCKQLAEPVIVLHADVHSGRSFWIAPQLEKFPSSWIDGSDGHLKVRVDIPLANELPQTVEQLVRTVGRLKLVIGTRAVLEAPVQTFLTDVKGQIDENELIRELRDKSDALRLSQLQRLYVGRQFSEAMSSITKILGDPDCSVENRFWAFLEKERIDWRVAAESGAPQGSLPEISLQNAKERQRLTKHGPAPLKFFALIDRKAAELDILCRRAAGLGMNYKNLVANNSMYWALHAFTERLALERKLWKSFNRCIRLVSYVSTSPYRFAQARPLCRIPQAILFYLVSLEADGRHDMANKFALSSFQISKLAAWIAERNGDYETLKLAASSAVPLAESAGEECVTWAREVVERIPDDISRKDGLALLDRQIRRSRGEKLKGDLYGPATSEQIYTNMAMGMGIDMSNSGDPIAQLVRVGIADSDPTRVLQTCKSIFISLGPVSPIEDYLLQRLGVPVGRKVIQCEKHRYGLRGRTLDQTYFEFESQYCSKCPDREPRTAEWKYSHEWHEREGKRLLPLIREFRKVRTP